MTTKTEILNLLSRLRPTLKNDFGVRQMALFGSYSRGDETQESDIDILVDVDPDIGLRFVTLAETLEKALGTHVDLVSSNAIKPSYMEFIKNELIYV